MIPFSWNPKTSKTDKVTEKVNDKETYWNARNIVFLYQSGVYIGSHI